MNLNVVDFIVLIFIVMTVINGMRKGFIMSLFHFVGIILSFFIAKEYYYILNKFLINNTKVDNTINEFASKKIAGIDSELGSTMSINDIFKGFDRLPFDLKTMFQDTFDISSANGLAANSVTLSDQVTTTIMALISFAITMLIVFFVMFVIASVLNTIVKLPVLNLANKLLGGGLGIIKSVFIVYLVFALATPLIMFSDEDNIATNQILESESSKIFYDNNLILNYLSYKNVLE